MKKWAESIQEIIPINIINDMIDTYEHKLGVEQIDPLLCDGRIIRTKYHDGTIVFRQGLLADVVSEIMSTNVTQIGIVTLTTDYVIADMKYGNSKQVARDTIIVPFVFT